jgi:hypothetical protein
MSLKQFFAKHLAKYAVYKFKQWSKKPIQTQEKVLADLISSAQKTVFGQDHDFDSIQTYEDFKSRVPIRDYEGFRHYIDRTKRGEESVLWPGRPLFFAKTSGTTSGAKYIPLTKDSMAFQISSAKDALLHYIYRSGNVDFVDGKMIFLQGSPILNQSEIIPYGRLSGIVANYVPSYLLRNRLPSYSVNCIEDWEQKLDAVVQETLSEDMRLISGIPSWVQMYFEKLRQSSGRSISELFPKFSLFVYGGVNYEPYRAKFESMIGKHIDSIELYPASEGFIAFQDNYKEKGLLLLLDSGIFYEFVNAEEFNDPDPNRIFLNEVQLGVNYVLILNTNAGLWGYNIGDLVQFISLDPFRIIVSGRIKHFTSAFGEHVIAKEVEESMHRAQIVCPETLAVEFTVAPQTEPIEGLPYHEWFIEFSQAPKNILYFSEVLDLALQDQNSYYKDLRAGKVLKCLDIVSLKKGAFHNYMKSQGRLGGQNKIPRLANDRSIANILSDMKE